MNDSMRWDNLGKQGPVICGTYLENWMSSVQQPSYILRPWKTVGTVRQTNDMYENNHMHSNISQCLKITCSVFLACVALNWDAYCSKAWSPTPKNKSLRAEDGQAYLLIFTQAALIQSIVRFLEWNLYFPFLGKVGNWDIWKKTYDMPLQSNCLLTWW